MKKGLLLFASCIIFLFGCSKDILFPDLSRKIYLLHKESKDRSSFRIDSLFQIARMKAFKKTLFLHEDLKDTLFVLEGYSIETRDVVGRIWTTKHKIDYEYFNKDLSIQELSAFSLYQISLITKWDTMQIRTKEKATLFDSRILKGTRCFMLAGKLNIQKIWFNDFFNQTKT